ncbi:unnamed protein product, partial [Ascophyllum nodosum]
MLLQRRFPRLLSQTWLVPVRQKNQRWQSPLSPPRNPRRHQWATPCPTLPTPCRKLRLRRPRRSSQWR